jgi:hypothetical protein
LTQLVILERFLFFLLNVFPSLSSLLSTMDFLRNNRLALHFLMGIVLTIIYPMQELFSGNQNIYFLWGMADLLPNAFAADPLLISPNPYPAFSWLITLFPIRFLSFWTTAIYVFLSFIYSFSLFGIADRIAPLYKNRTQFFSFVTLFLFLHSSPIWGTYFNLVFDVDLRWVWDSGIAEQGVLRGYLQPSVFGVFLLLSLYQVMRRNYALAILCIAPAAAFHASYVFLGGIMTILILLQSNFGKKNLLAAVILLLLVLPYSYYIFSNFVQVDETMKMAINQAVMAGYDENIHINPANWLGPKLYLQLLCMVIGAIALWKTHLRTVILGVIVFGILLTALAYVVDNTTLISLNPWRVSILIMPIASIAILSSIVNSSIWTVICPHILSFIGVACLALVFYRVFGNSSVGFIGTWTTIQIAAFILVSISAGFVFKNETLNKLLTPVIIIALITVGLVDQYVNRISKSNTDEFKAIAATNTTSEPNTVYIIPADWTSFRMNAQKAVFADQNLVYGSALPSLMQRLKMLESAYESDDFSSVVGSVPAGTIIKLIAPSTTEIPTSFSKDALTNNFSCITLRQ